jgi:hypothetical protein
MSKKKKKLKAIIQVLNEELSLTEEMCEKLDATNELNMTMTRYHLQQCKATTGEILMEDVDYCISLGKRILAKIKADYEG